MIDEIFKEEAKSNDEIEPTGSEVDTSTEEASGLESEGREEEKKVSEDETIAAASQTPLAEWSVWRVMRPLVGFFLAKGYRTLPR